MFSAVPLSAIREGSRHAIVIHETECRRRDREDVAAGKFELQGVEALASVESSLSGAAGTSPVTKATPRGTEGKGQSVPKPAESALQRPYKWSARALPQPHWDQASAPQCVFSKAVTRTSTPPGGSGKSSN